MRIFSTGSITTIAIATVGCLVAAAPPASASVCPRRALVIGDSNVAGSLGARLERLLSQAGLDVLRRGHSGSGLARPDFFDWRAEAQALLEASNPDFIVLMLGGNDTQGLKAASRGAKSVRWGSPQWMEAYGDRLAEFVRELQGEHRTVLLLSPTNRRPIKAREGVQRVIKAQRAAMAWLDDVRWVDTYELTSDERGKPLLKGRSAKGKRVAFRKRDGIHLTKEGSSALIQKLAPIVASSLATGCGGTVTPPWDDVTNWVRSIGAALAAR